MYDNKIFTIHFPGKVVYIENTYGTIEEKIEKIKNDKDHCLYYYFNPKIIKEEDKDKKQVAVKYYRNWFNVIIY